MKRCVSKALIPALLLALLPQFSFPQHYPRPGKKELKRERKKLKKFDLFSGRFSPQWETGVAAGLVPTFFKDEGRSILPPLQFRLGRRFSPTFSLAALAGVSRSRNPMPYYDSRTYIACINTFRMAALRPTGHLRMGNRAEAFGGLLLAWQHNSIRPVQPVKEQKPNPAVRPGRGLFFAAFIGARQALTPDLGIYGELSFGLSIASLGISMRLR